jgi:hypothetical protein
MPDKIPQEHTAGLPFHGYTSPPCCGVPCRSSGSGLDCFGVSPVRASISVYLATTFSDRQESMGLPKFPAYLFLRAMACGLRRIYSSSPITDEIVLPSEPVTSSASATSLFRSCTSTSGSADSPTACKILCLRFNCLVRQTTTLTPPQLQDSIRSGGLVLLRQGLSPCKIRRTLLGAKRAGDHRAAFWPGDLPV